MSLRPGTLCKLEKGKLIDSQQGFVDTFNWMVDFINNLRGDGDGDAGKSIRLDRSVSDHPVITFDGGLSATGGEYVAGDDTRITFTPLANGKTAINVYYK